MSKTMERDFFSYRDKNGLRGYTQQSPDRPDAIVPGEVTPSYFHEPAAAPCAQAYDSALQILVSLRDRVRREGSQHRHLVRVGTVPIDYLNFESALASYPSQIEQSRRHQDLERWIATFGRGQVGLMDNIQRDSTEVARALYSFLGVERAHLPAELNVRSDSRHVVKNTALEGSVHGLREGLASLGAEHLRRTLGDSGLRDLFRRRDRRPRNTVTPAPLPETLQALRGVFRGEACRLVDPPKRDLYSRLPQ